MPESRNDFGSADCWSAEALAEGIRRIEDLVSGRIKGLTEEEFMGQLQGTTVPAPTELPPTLSGTPFPPTASTT